MRFGRDVSSRRRRVGPRVGGRDAVPRDRARGGVPRAGAVRVRRALRPAQAGPGAEQQRRERARALQRATREAPARAQRARVRRQHMTSYAHAYQKLLVQFQNPLWA